MASSKNKAGIPSGFKLGIAKMPEPATSDTPIRLPDYLEMDAIRTVIERPPVAKPVVSRELQIEVQEPASATREPSPREHRARIGKSVSRERAGKSTSPIGRTKVNISEETQRRLDRIVQHVARYGGERHVRAADILDAVIMALEERCEKLDVSGLRRRGKYGSITARNFGIALAACVPSAFTKDT